MLYSCTYVVTVGVKGLNYWLDALLSCLAVVLIINLTTFYRVAVLTVFSLIFKQKLVEIICVDSL